MERVRTCVICGFFLFLASAQPVFAEDTATPPVFIQSSLDLSSGAPKIVSTSNDTAAPVPGELIVKYKSSAGAVIPRIQSLRTTAQPSLPLDRIHKKLGVISARHLFKEHGTSSTESLLRHERAKRSHPSRMRRVPQLERAPDLSNVYVLKVPEKTNIEAALRELRSEFQWFLGAGGRRFMGTAEYPGRNRLGYFTRRQRRGRCGGHRAGLHPPRYCC